MSSLLPNNKPGGGEFNLNMLRVGRKIFLNQKENVADSKYPDIDMCERVLVVNNHLLSTTKKSSVR